MFSIAKRNPSGLPLPTLLSGVTLTIAALAAIPTTLLGGIEAVSMLALGAGLGLASVLGGYFCSALAFRGPDRYATKLVVGGFLIRMALLFALVAAIVSATGIEPSRFILWLVCFYFVLVMVEAWILARESSSASQEGTAS
jgi:hypothetical protein